MLFVLILFEVVFVVVGDLVNVGLIISVVNKVVVVVIM